MRWPFFKRAPRPDPAAIAYRHARYLGADSLSGRPELQAALRLIFEASWGACLEVELEWGEAGGEISARNAYLGWESGPRALEPGLGLDLELAFRRAAFWEAPRHDFASLERDQYVLERREGDRYHVVFRGQAPEGDPLGALLLELKRLGDLELEPIARKEFERMASEQAQAEARSQRRCPWGGCPHPRAPGDDVCFEHRARLNLCGRALWTRPSSCP